MSEDNQKFSASSQKDATTSLKGKKTSPDLIVSVESRKGGVGKTTAALCLAKVLANKKYKHDYAVLVLDLDFTGTNTSFIASSRAWQEYIHIIDVPNAKTTNSAEERRFPLNLLELFKSHFLGGKALPDFSIIENIADRLVIDSSKANLIGSSIFADADLSAEKTAKESGQSESKYIERPNILFGDLYSYWLLDFIKGIVSRFVILAGERKTAIVLDNSPGYVGIAPAVHEWLTDLGPKTGKFLTVTSLDIQDFVACSCEMKAIHDLFKDKWEASKAFIGACEDGSELKINKRQEPFFLRLATGLCNSPEDDDCFSFYLGSGRRGSDKLGVPDKEGEDYCNNPERYIEAIINRVPQAVKNEGLLYLLHGVSNIGLSASQQKSIQMMNLTPTRMITHDQYIESQFYVHALHARRELSNSDRSKLLERLREYERSLREIDYKYLSRSARDKLVHIMDDEGELLQNRIIRASLILRDAIAGLADAGLSHVADLFSKDWLSDSICPEFKKQVRSFWDETDFLFVDSFNGMGNSESAASKRELASSLTHDLLKRIYGAKAEDGARAFDPNTVEFFVESMVVLFIMCFPMAIHDPMTRQRIQGLISVIVKVEMSLWSSNSKWFMSDRKDPISFLAQCSSKRISFRKIVIKDSGAGELFPNWSKKTEASLRRVFNACTYAQSRLLDYMQDSAFLIELIRACCLIEDNNLIKPHIKGIVDNVIIRKLKPYDNAVNELDVTLKKAEYFAEFEDVLVSVLKVWGIRHE